jgi:predicted double-glycine peptidase
MSKQPHRIKAPISFALQQTPLHSISQRAVRIPLPNIVARTPSTCGAAALLAVCRFFGVGPVTEAECVVILKRCGYHAQVGVHPDQLARAARDCGLKARIERNMERRALISLLKQRIPVLLTIQAWAGDAMKGTVDQYAKKWNSGHWVVAIGFDRNGIIVEDPWLEASRGYLSNESLISRWHDTEEQGRRYYGTGVPVWISRPAKHAYFLSSRVLG